MNVPINAKRLRSTLPDVVERVRKSTRFTVIYRSRPALQIVPVDDHGSASIALADDTLYRAQTVGSSEDGRTSIDHDATDDHFPRSASTCCRQFGVGPLESRGAPDRAGVVDPAVTRARQSYPAVAHVRRRAAGLFGGSMRLSSLIALAAVLALATPRAQTVTTHGGEPELKVVLLGTMGGPTFSGERLGISTLVIAGDERLLFDAGRSLTTGLARLNINPAGVTRVFLTHLHSDHIVSLPELLLFPWAQGRVVPLQVWGPTGTSAMMERLQEAFAFDIHVRRDVDERFSPEGIKVQATDIREGVVYESNGVKVTAFLVDHAPIEPAFGFRVDYRGRSVALSGDTKPSDNLVKVSQGVDVLVHEVGSWKQDPNLAGPPDDRFPGSAQTRRQVQTIRNHHTDGAEAGSIFERVKPRLAVFSHYNVDPATTLRLVRQIYTGPVEFGEDLMTIDIGNTIAVHRFILPSK